MNISSKINEAVFNEVIEHLDKIEKEHNVVILQAIESGSRAWGFPSPDSDYDVRFVYTHSKDWYLQLTEERDVIELPINDELDIAGWDVRKAFNLANKGNAVIQEWMISPIVYKQSSEFNELFRLVSETFNPVATYHHYRSMAKKAHLDIEGSKQKKLKRFFYFARATLSAKWVAEKHTMPSIVFTDLIEGIISDQSIAKNLELLVARKAEESEKSILEVPASVYDFVSSLYLNLEEQVMPMVESKPISNDGFRNFFSNQI